MNSQNTNTSTVHVNENQPWVNTTAVQQACRNIRLEDSRQKSGGNSKYLIACKVYTRIAEMQQPSGWTNPISQRELANSLNMSERTVKYALKRLHDGAYPFLRILTDRQGRNDSFRYRLPEVQKEPKTFQVVQGGKSESPAPEQPAAHDDDPLFLHFEAYTGKQGNTEAERQAWNKVRPEALKIVAQSNVSSDPAYKRIADGDLSAIDELFNKEYFFDLVGNAIRRCVKKQNERIQGTDYVARNLSLDRWIGEFLLGDLKAKPKPYAPHVY